jgi:hypothetical protein
MNWRFSYQIGTTAWDSYTWAKSANYRAPGR